MLNAYLKYTSIAKNYIVIDRLQFIFHVLFSDRWLCIQHNWQRLRGNHLKKTIMLVYTGAQTIN